MTIKSSELRERGPLIEVVLVPSTALRKELEGKGQTISSPVRKTFLIDTGASSSLMKTGTANELGLLPKGVVYVNTPSDHAVRCFTYDLDILFPDHRAIVNVLVCEAPLTGQNIDGLLGRDVLQNCLLVYSGYDNQFTLAI